MIIIILVDKIQSFVLRERLRRPLLLYLILVFLCLILILFFVDIVMFILVYKKVIKQLFNCVSVLDKMAVMKIVLTFTLLCALTYAQRPFYAGSRPIGYPQISSNALFNRFGESADAPIEARGDANLINRLNQMPVDKRPFWFVNWRQYDNLRKNPVTYQQRPNVFINNI